MTDKKQKNYAAKMKKASEKIRKKRSFISLFLPRLLITFAVLCIIGMLVCHTIMREYNVHELFGEKTREAFLSKNEYNIDGNKYLDVLYSNSTDQWITSVRQMERGILPIALGESGFWGIYDYKNDKWLTEYSENSFILILTFRGGDKPGTPKDSDNHKLNDVYDQNEESTHAYSLIENQKNAFMDYMKNTGSNRLSSNVYISSGYIMGTEFAVEKYRIGENGQDIEMPLGDMSGWEYFTLDIFDKSDMEDKSYDKNLYWDGINNHYGAIGIHDISSKGCLINSSCFAEGDYEQTPISGKIDLELKETAKKYLDEYANEIYGDPHASQNIASNSSDMWHTSGITHDRVWIRSMLCDGGNVYGLIYTAYYSNKYLSYLLVGIIIGAFFISIVIALLWARALYIKYKIQREMYEYRIMLTNTMAHDLKSPLMAISAYIDNILENTNPQKNEYYLKEISKKTSYMNGLIENILELSKSEKMVVEKREQLDIKKCLEEIKPLYEEQLQQKQLTVAIDGSRKLDCDKNSMTIVLRNIFENAVKYSDTNGNIQIILSDDKITFKNPASQLSVSIDKIFEAFIKDDSSRSGAKGNGLGLSIVKAICDAHGYKVSADYNNGIFEISLMA